VIISFFLSWHCLYAGFSFFLLFSPCQFPLHALRHRLPTMNLLPPPPPKPPTLPRKALVMPQYRSQGQRAFHVHQFFLFCLVPFFSLHELIVKNPSASIFWPRTSCTECFCHHVTFPEILFPPPFFSEIFLSPPPFCRFFMSSRT